jgi:hypothetical protein
MDCKHKLLVVVGGGRWLW